MPAPAAFPPPRAARVRPFCRPTAARVLGACAAILLVGAAPLTAQRSPDAAAAAPPAAQDAPSPATAGILSFATTAVPTVAGVLIGDLEGFAIAGTGLIFGPLSGYAYGGAMERGSEGLALRLFVAGGSTIAIFTMCQLGDCDFFGDGDVGLSTAAGLTFFLGSAVILGSAAIDALSAPEHVRRANAARAGSGAELSLLPLLPTRERGVGVVARLRF